MIRNVEVALGITVFVLLVCAGSIWWQIFLLDSQIKDDTNKLIQQSFILEQKLDNVKYNLNDLRRHH